MKTVCFSLTFFLSILTLSALAVKNPTSIPSTRPDGRTVLKPNVVNVEDLFVPEKATAQLREAEKDAKAARPDQALKHLEKAIEIYPKFSPAHNNMGLLYMEAGKTGEAEKAFLNAVKTGATNACAHQNLGYLYLMLDRPKDAIDPLSKAAHLGDPDPDVLSFLGEALYLEGRYQEAAGTFREALILEPRHCAAAYRLACAEARLGHFTEALAVLRDLGRSEHPGIADQDIEALAKALEAKVSRSSVQSN